MATTRLSQIGIGARPYAGFSPKAEAPPGARTRLMQIAIGGRRYKEGAFAGKTPQLVEPSTEDDVVMMLVDPGRLMN